MIAETVNPRDLNEGAIRLYTEHTTSKLSYGAKLPVSGIAEANWENDIETDESYGEARLLDLFSQVRGYTGSVKAVQMALGTLSALVGSSLIESATPGEYYEWTPDEDTVSPYFQLALQSKYLGQGLTGAVEVYFEMCKITKLGFVFQRGYAEVSFDWSGFAVSYENLDSKRIMHRILVRAGTNLTLQDANSYMPPRQQIPLWAPDAATGFTGRTTDAAIIQQRAYKSSTEGDFMEWTRALGAGSNVLTFFAQTGSDRGVVEVLLDGVLVAAVDLYAASSANNYKAQAAFTVATSGSHAIRLRIGTKNASSTGDLVEISSAEITHLGSSPVVAINTLPTPAPAVAQISAYQYTAASAAPVVVNPATNAGEKVEQQGGLASWLEYEVKLEAGTYSVKALLGKASDYGSVTFSIDGVALGVVDTYNASTVTPDVIAVPGTFVLKRRAQVKLRITSTSKNASSTGYNFMLAWLGIYRSVGAAALQYGDNIPTPLHFLPWHADALVGWTPSAASVVRNWKHVSDGVANREIKWEKTFLGKGVWRARLAGKIEASGATLELHHGGAKVATFDLSGTASDNGRLESVFTTTLDKLSDLVIKNPSTTAATVYYLQLESLNESKSLGTIFIVNAAEHHIPDHRNGDAWAGLSYVFEINGSPADFTGATAKWRVYSGSLSGTVVVEKTESAGLTLAGDTLTVDPFTPTLSPGTYYYDLQITLSGGSATTYVHGTWTII